MRVNEHQKGRCYIHSAKFKLNQLLQRPVHYLHNAGHNWDARKNYGKALDTHRLEIFALVPKRLVQEEMVIYLKLFGSSHLKIIVWKSYLKS